MTCSDLSTTDNIELMFVVSPLFVVRLDLFKQNQRLSRETYGEINQCVKTKQTNGAQTNEQGTVGEMHFPVSILFIKCVYKPNSHHQKTKKTRIPINYRSYDKVTPC